jgi:hypothetical protein
MNVDLTRVDRTEDLAQLRGSAATGERFRRSAHRRTLWPNRCTLQQRVVEYRTNVDAHLGARVAAGLGYGESAKAA